MKYKVTFKSSSYILIHCMKSLPSLDLLFTVIVKLEDSCLDSISWDDKYSSVKGGLLSIFPGYQLSWAINEKVRELTSSQTDQLSYISVITLAAR